MIFVGAVLAATLAWLIGLLVFSHVSGVAEARARLAHTHEVIEQNQALFTLVQDAEASQRGYLITGDPAQLAPYDKAQTAIPVAEARLAQAVAENPGQSQQVRDLNIAISERMAILERGLSRARQGDFEGARAVVRSGAGESAMSQVREKSSVISALERILLEQRTQRADRQDRLNLIIGLTVGGLALLGLIWTIWSLARGNDSLLRAMDEVRAAESARESSDALQRAIFSNAPDYLYVLDIEPGDRFVVGDVNPAFERALGVSAARIRGRALQDLLPGDAGEPLIAHYRRVRAADEPVLTRNTLPGLPGGPRTWETILAPVKNAEGVTDRIVGVSRDITDRVRAEERLRSAQRMEAVGQLTGGVAHDFNNLLQVIRGNLDLLESRVKGDATAERRLKSAIHGAERAGQLTRQLLAFARRQPLDPEVVNLSRLVGEMADLIRRTLGEAITVRTVVGEGLWNTLADPAQVESALLNLALNARDAMPDGGALTIELANAVLEEADIRPAEEATPGDYVRLAVADTGVGMDPRTQARVFEPFFTTKAEGRGTGLGLAMVYGFVRQSNGHVQIDSAPGRGTTVRIYLPRAEAEEEIAAPALPAAADGGGRRILVVEDEEAVRAAAVAMLQGLGYETLEAGQADEALAKLDAGAKVDLVFTDVVMPGPLRMRDFAEAVRRKGLPILFTSGYTEDAIVHRGRLDEGVTLISKPYGRDELAAKIAQMIAQGAAEVRTPARDVSEDAAAVPPASV